MHTFSAAVKSANNGGRCHKNPTERFRNSATALSTFVSMAFVPKYTVPLVGVSSAASKWSNVLFPAPDGATIATISPRRKLRFASTKIGSVRSPEPYDFFKLQASRTTAASGEIAEALNLIGSGLESLCIFAVQHRTIAEFVLHLPVRCSKCNWSAAAGPRNTNCRRPRFFPFLADHYLALREPRSVSI